MSRLTNGRMPVSPANALYGQTDPRIQHILDARAKQAATATPIAPAFRHSFNYPTYKAPCSEQDRADHAAGNTLSAAEYAALQAAKAEPVAPAKPVNRILFSFAQLTPAPHFALGLDDAAPESDDADVYRGTRIEDTAIEVANLTDALAINRAEQVKVCVAGESALARGDQAAAERIYFALTPLHRDYEAMSRRLAALMPVEPIEADHTAQDEADVAANETVHADILLLDEIDDLREVIDGLMEQHEEARARQDYETTQLIVNRVMAVQRDKEALERVYAEGRKAEPACRLEITDMGEREAPDHIDDAYRAMGETMTAEELVEYHADLEELFRDRHAEWIDAMELAEAGMNGTSAYVDQP